MESDKNIMPEFKLFPDAIKLAKAFGGVALGLFQFHLLSPVSEHFSKPTVDDMLLTEDLSGMAPDYLEDGQGTLW